MHWVPYVKWAAAEVSDKNFEMLTLFILRFHHIAVQLDIKAVAGI